MSKSSKFPKHLTHKGTGAVQLSSDYNGVASYWRHGGRYSVIVRHKDGVFQGKCSGEKVYSLVLTECTEDDWRKSNGEYAPEEVNSGEESEQ